MKKYLRTFAAKFLDYLTQLIPIRMASSIEWRIQRVLGKGIGSASLKDEIRTIAIFVDNLKIKDIILFDIGANIGQYASAFISKFPKSEVHSFEPSITAFSDLSISATSNPNWKVHNFGFGDLDAELPLRAPILGSASASLVPHEKVFGRDLKLTTEIVRIKRLDGYLTNGLEPIPSIVKIDIEGYELNCLLGAGTLIRDFSIIQFEFGEINVDSRTYFKDYWNFFSNYGFRIFRITTKRPIEIIEYNESLETFAVTNYLAVKPT